jgi:hypothetical protein
MIKKSAISLISYDAQYLPASIEKYYDYVDEIVLGLDKDRITWSGNPFTFEESKLWNDLNTLDGDKKISIVEENFHQATVAIENDNYERNFLKAQCSSDWIISIDADEYLVNAKEFFYNFCPIVERYSKRADICMIWALPYKIIDDTVLVIANEDNSPFFGENQGVMTHKNNTYTYARWTDVSAAGMNRIQSPLVSIHWSICRPQADLYQKIHNIGHSDIVEKDPFYQIWKDVTLENYNQLRNFKTSGLGGAQWPKLVKMPLTELETFYTTALTRAY